MKYLLKDLARFLEIWIIFWLHCRRRTSKRCSRDKQYFVQFSDFQDFVGFRRESDLVTLFFSSVRLLDGWRRQLAAGGCYLLKSSKHGGSLIQDRVTAAGFWGGFPPQRYVGNSYHLRSIFHPGPCHPPAVNCSTLHIHPSTTKLNRNQLCCHFARR